MAAISVDLIKKLRQETQVSMMACKKALIEAEGNYEEAVASLRKKGASVAAKRADNATNNGTIKTTIAPDFRSGSMVETSCETDFSANTDDLRGFAQMVANHLLATDHAEDRVASSTDSIAALMEQSLLDGSSLKMQDKLDELISKITESIKVSRYARLENSNGVVNAYVHPGSKPVGVLVELEIEGERPADITSLVQAAKDVGMQVAVSNPQCIDPEQLPAEVIAAERDIYAEQLRSQGKPEAMIDKIMGGKLEKFYEGVCLHRQKFIKEEKKTIQQMLDEVGKAHGVKVRVGHFVRFAIGG
ncbi:MAG: translation elongation factor Ts [Candidatus Dependentiae bacterium]